LKPGNSIDDFLEGFPSVEREQVVAFLEKAKDRLVESLSRRYFPMGILIAAGAQQV
jgi:uncharacterized protein (DUF433 family)